MKKNLLLLTAIAFVFFSCGSSDSTKDLDDKIEDLLLTTDDAIAYNDEIVGIQQDVDYAILDVYNALETYDIDIMNDTKAEAIQIIDDAKEEIEDLGDFDGEDGFQKASLDLIDMYEDILLNELTQLIEYSANIDNLTDEEYDDYDKTIDMMLEKYDKAFDNFELEQELFAINWDFEIKDSEY